MTSTFFVKSFVKSVSRARRMMRGTNEDVFHAIYKLESECRKLKLQANDLRFQTDALNREIKESVKISYLEVQCSQNSYKENRFGTKLKL